jgi:uncharacterized membrane protein
MKSKFMNLGMKDFLRGLVISIVSTILVGLTTALDSGMMPTPEQWKYLIITGIGSGVAYLAKNLFTNSEDQFLKKESNL